MDKNIQWLLKDKYHGKPTKQFYKDVERLKAGEPLDYVIGFTMFLNCKIDLSKKPLIPRVETEFWMDEVLKELKDKSKPLQILDIFAGSGCVGLSIMRHIKNAKVTFVDNQKNALAQIRINTKLNKLPKAKYKIIKSDIFSNVSGSFDYIFANPPYIPTVKRRSIQKSVLDYEPKQALFGGMDGLAYIKKFLEKAGGHLKSGGVIYMEFDPHQKPAIERLLKKNGYQSWEFKKDQYKRYRYVIIH